MSTELYQMFLSVVRLFLFRSASSLEQGERSLQENSGQWD
jgi:hypothetical protein